MSEDALRGQLFSGKSLADVAKAKGKSVSGLEQAMLAAARTQLADAVKRGFLTPAQARKMEAMLARHINDLVQGRPSSMTPGVPFGNQQPGSAATSPAGSAA
jgi:hypothetical protein